MSLTQLFRRLHRDERGGGEERADQPASPRRRPLLSPMES